MQGAAATSAATAAVKRKKDKKKNEPKYQPLHENSKENENNKIRQLQPSYLTPVVPQPYRIRTDVSSNEYETLSPVSARRTCKCNMNYLVYFVFCTLLFFMAIAQLSPGKICYQNQIGSYKNNGIMTANLTSQSCTQLQNVLDEGLPDLVYTTTVKNSTVLSPFNIRVTGGWGTRNTTFHMIGCVLSLLLGLWIAFSKPALKYRTPFWLSIFLAWLVALILDVTTIRDWNKEYCLTSAKETLESILHHSNADSPDYKVAASLPKMSPLVRECRVQVYQYTSILVVICLISSIVLFVISLLERKLEKLKDEPEAHYTMLVEEEEGRGTENVVHI